MLENNQRGPGRPLKYDPQTFIEMWRDGKTDEDIIEATGVTKSELKRYKAKFFVQVREDIV
jgi:hypothetical protein